MATKPTITKAGFALIAEYVAQKNAGRKQRKLSVFFECRGDTQVEVMALRLGNGDGAAKSAASKLARDGYGRLVWSALRSVRCFIPNDAAILALQSAQVEG